MLGLACGGGWDVGGHGAVLPAVFAGRDAAFSLEYLREVALVAETCCHGDVMDAEVGVFEVSAGGVHPLLNDVSAGTDAYYSSDFYVLKYADPVLYKKSEYIVDPREELKLSAKYPSAGTSSEESWPGSVDITLELLKDTGIDPIAGNATDCIIEEEIGGVWYTIPRPDYYMTLEGYVPMVGHPVEQTVALSGRVQHPGHYRVLKPVITGRGSAIVHEYYAAEFYVNGR